MSEKGNENTQPWEKKKKSTEPASLLQMNFSLKKCPDKLGEGGENLSDVKFLAPLSTGTIFHEVWPCASLTTTKTAQSRDKQKWNNLVLG